MPAVGVIPASQQRPPRVRSYHGTIRDYFCAWHLHTKAETGGWYWIAYSYFAHGLMVFLSGMVRPIYKLLDFLYETAKFRSHVADYLAIGLEHGIGVDDTARNRKYFSMIFYYREDLDFVGKRSLPMLLDFVNNVQKRNVAALRKVFELAGKEARDLLRELMASDWKGKWTVISSLPLLNKREMCRVIECMFRDADSNQQRLRLIELLATQDGEMSRRLLRRLKETNRSRVAAIFSRLEAHGT